MSQTGPLKLGAIHPITGRQWELGKNEAWPDLEIVLPFSRRVIDNTGTVIGPAVSSENIGGYEVVHSLKKIEIFDLINNSVVPNVKGVWAAGPGGDTARIHLLAQDPYSWLTPHGYTILTAFETPPKVVEQSFGYGQAETFTEERRFGEMLVKPAVKTDLITLFQPPLPTRVMKCEKFTLSFRTLDGAPIHIDELSLLILGRDIKGPFFTVTGAGGVTYTFVRPICGDLSLILASVALSVHVDSVGIESPKGVPMLVYAVRYREARKYVTKWSEKTILVPGKYSITIEGESKATSPAGLPASKTVSWSLKQEFGVKYPETLRPYIKYSTIGDNRIFSAEPVPPPPSLLAWNPTMLGVGFPSYRKYLAIVRFLVPYMSAIYSPIKMQVMYEKGSPPPSLTDDLTPKANSDGDSSLPQKSQDWIAAAGGSIMLDEELIFTKELPHEGLAKVVLSFTLPDGKEVKLDEWSCYISRFDSFSQHLEWPGDCLQVYYDSAGKHAVPSCPTLISTISYPIKLKGNRMDALPKSTVSKSKLEHEITSGLLGTSVSVEEVQPYPDELTSVPLDWRLPISMVDNLKPFDQHTGVRFARFAHESGASFNECGGDKLNGIQDTVDYTTVEAVADAQGRPLALWVRTPEPVDWRRVTATLKIKHVNQTGSCPTGYAHRRQMDLTVAILPSPDATSAFLIGFFAGTATRLPRGEYELVISFDPYKTGLQKLRPSTSVSTIPEQVKMKFIQPFGLDWPLPSTGIMVPAWLLEKLFEAYHRPEPPGPVPIGLLKIYEDYVRFGKLIGTRREALSEAALITKPIESGLIQGMLEKTPNLERVEGKSASSKLRPSMEKVFKPRDSTPAAREMDLPKKSATSGSKEQQKKQRS